jgi:phosphoribosylformimino-5-aminoimidazole carboxamide ribonucleotide (ProFAR) isomerase
MKSEKDIQVAGGINISKDAMEKWKEDYKMLIASGMAWEFHPWLTGNWNDDKERYIKEIVNWYANTED